MCAMIADLEAHFREFIPPRDELLLRLEQEAQAEGIPIIGPVVGELLFILARATQARRILELGTATGYSAIYLARGCEPCGGKVITLESDPTMAARARANFDKAGLTGGVEVREGEALASATASASSAWEGSWWPTTWGSPGPRTSTGKSSSTPPGGWRRCSAFSRSTPPNGTACLWR